MAIKVVKMAIINQIGVRLGFTIEHGLYRGRQNDIGYDGIWHSKEHYSLVVEVKTTDAYRINLDIIAAYRDRLIEKGSSCWEARHRRSRGTNKGLATCLGRSGDKR